MEEGDAAAAVVFRLQNNLMDWIFCGHPMVGGKQFLEQLPARRIWHFRNGEY